MTKTTSPHGLPYPETGDYIGSEVSPEKTIRQDIESLAAATNRELITATGATSAVADDLESQPQRLDLVTGADSRAMMNAQGSTYAWAVVDSGGKIAGGVKDSGVWNFETPPSLYGHGDVTMIPSQDTDVAWAVIDSQGRAAIAVYSDGTVFVQGMDGAATSLQAANDFIGYSRSSRTAIACVGDSQTISLGGTWPESETYPGVLRTLVPAGVTVTNRGRSGFMIDEESISIGALPLLLSIDGGSIPASGPVGVTLSGGDSIGWANLGVTRTFTGTLAGVAGTLTRKDSNTALVFTRTTTGTSVPATGTHQWKSSWDVHANDTMFTQLGRNNVAFNISGVEGNVVQHVINGYKRIHDYLKPQIKQFLALSVTTAQTETAGTGGHATVLAINAGLSEVFGPRYLDFRTRLVTQGMQDASITPTSEDLTAVAADTLPPSLMDDNIHYNRTAAALVAQYAFEYISSREWVKP